MLPSGADVVEREDTPIRCVQIIPMMTPNFVLFMHFAWMIVRYYRQNVYWFMADLALGKKPYKALEHDLFRVLGMSSKQRWIGKRIGSWSSPEGREYRVESQAIRQAPDHHPRVQ